MTHNGVLFEEQKGEASRIHVFFDESILNRARNPTRIYSVKWSMLHYNLSDYETAFDYENILKEANGAKYLERAKK